MDSKIYLIPAKLTFLVTPEIMLFNITGGFAHCDFQIMCKETEIKLL